MGSNLGCPVVFEGTQYGTSIEKLKNYISLADSIIGYGTSKMPRSQFPKYDKNDLNDWFEDKVMLPTPLLDSQPDLQI